MTKTETMDEKSLDEIISESEKRFDRLNKKAYRLMNGIKANGHPRTTRKTILDVLACVSDGSVILGVLMQADIWAESGVFCTEQGDGTLKFTCVDVPTADISVNVVVEG